MRTQICTRRVRPPPLKGWGTPAAWHPPRGTRPLPTRLSRVYTSDMASRPVGPELPIGPELVGQTVCVPTRPEWGDGKVLRVEAVEVNGQPAQRVSIQFSTGHRALLVPPATLVAPTAEPSRVPGWLDSLSGRTLDDRLKKLPASADALGNARAKLDALAPLYVWTGTGSGPASHGSSGLLEWARRQANVADPLSHWNRDELETAFAAFCGERDARLRALLAVYQRDEGQDAMRAWVAAQTPQVRDAIRAAVQRPI